MLATARAAVVYGALLLGVLVLAAWPEVPRSLGIFQPVLFLLLLGASRAMARFWLADRAHRAQPCVRLTIYGAGTAGVRTAAMGISGQYKLLGFIDDDRYKVGRSMNGVTESPRILSRLKFLRGLSHEEIKQVFPRSARTRSAHGAGAPKRLPLAVGGH